ncbi:MAG: hypothetical protein Q8O72_14625 [Bacteroidales bacterium]|nr:hypothetical protein [Bacteroidales bacterium]
MSEQFPYEVNVSDDKKLATALKQRINNWANDIPHHPYKNLGDKISITGIWYKPAYPIRVRSQYEERSKHKGEEPFTDQKIPERTYFKLSDFNSWDIKLKDIGQFDNSTKNYYLNGSQYVEACYKCNARGWITCVQCQGTTTVTCPVCRGAKKTTCYSCSGSGKEQCSSCGGRGYNTRQVSHSRQVYVSEGNYRTETYYETVRESCYSCSVSGSKTCYRCSGTGKITCSGCSGRGYVTCPTCHGSGRNTCPVCNGHTRLMHHFYIKRDLEYTDKQTCVIHGEVYKAFPQFLDEYTEYESYNVFTNKAKKVSTGQLPEGHHLNPFINKYIEEAHDDNTSSHVMQFQQVDVDCIDTWELTYQFKGKEYRMVFTGSDYHVIPGLSPIYEVAYSFWDRGVNASRWFMFSRAARLLSKAQHIDVFEIKDQVGVSLEKVRRKIDQSYILGAKITALLLAFFGSFVVYGYFSEVNYVFAYADFINNSGNFLYDYHAWSQTLIYLLITYLGYKLAKTLTKKFSYHLPSSLLRILSSALITILLAALLTAVWGLLNATGATVAITFAVWLILKILKIIVFVLGFAIAIVVFLAKALWSIILWIVGLFT